MAQTQSGPPAHHDALQRQLTAAQGRHLRAIEALARYRRLLRPAMSPLEVASKLGLGPSPIDCRRDTGSLFSAAAN